MIDLSVSNCSYSLAKKDANLRPVAQRTLSYSRENWSAFTRLKFQQDNLVFKGLIVTKRRLSQQQKEQRDTTKYLRKRLVWCNQTGQKFDESKEQYSILPRSLADLNGIPHKGNKSKWTEKLSTRYESMSAFLTVLEWVPEVTIIDAMFMINTNFTPTKDL